MQAAVRVVSLRQRWSGAVGILALGLAAASCAWPPGSSPDPQVAMTLSEFAFEPAQLNLERGKKTILVLQNRGTVEHSFAIPKQNLPPTRVGAGQTARAEIALPPGTFQFVCIIEGHEQAGMVGQITSARPR